MNGLIYQMSQGTHVSCNKPRKPRVQTRNEHIDTAMDHVYQESHGTCIGYSTRPFLRHWPVVSKEVVPAAGVDDSDPLVWMLRHLLV